jgi:hypothetical protein
VLRIFSVFKNPSSSAACEPANFGSNGHDATLYRQGRQIVIILKILFVRQLASRMSDSVSYY